MLAELHTFIRRILRKERTGHIPPELITSSINSASKDLWRHLIKKAEAGVFDDLLQSFRDKTTLTIGSSNTITDGGNDFIVSAIYGDVSAIVARNDVEFANLKLANVVDSESEHLFKSEYQFTLSAADNGKKNLPTYFVGHFDTFIHYYNGETHEGNILSFKDFIDRKNSSIINPSVERPIATIHDNQIEVWPKPTGGTAYSFGLPYWRFPSIEKPILRFRTNSDDMVAEVRPSTFTGSIDVYHINHPVETEATYSISGGQVSVTVTTDLDWDVDAFGELASRSLKFLGLANADQLITEVGLREEMKDGNK